MSSSVLYDVLGCAFWGALTITLYTYLGYPMWIGLRSRLYPVPWRQAPVQPSVSIVLVVHNGAALLGPKIDHLLALDYPEDRIDIVVVSDGSTDGTDRVLGASSHPRLKSIVCQEHRGKAAALNEGIQIASGEILLFIDIRPWLDTKALQLLVSNFADPQVGCVAGDLILREEGHDAGTKAVMGHYWRFEQWIRNCEARVDSSIGVYGGFYAVRRRLVKMLPAGVINDDMFQSFSLIQQRYRSVLDVRARVYDTWPKTSLGEFNRKVRTLAGNFQLLQLAPWLLSRQNRLRFEFISHKLLRLLVPALLVIMLITSGVLASGSLLYASALTVQIGLYILALLGIGQGVPVAKNIAGPAYAFFMLNAAVVVGLYKFLFTRGPLWKIWVAPRAESAAAGGAEHHKRATARP